MKSSFVLPPHLKLRLGRVLWFFVALASTIVLIASILPRYQQLATVTTTPNTPAGQLLPSEAEALLQLGFSTNFYALYFTILESVGVLAFLAISTFLFSRRSEDPIVLLFALGLTTLGLISSPLTTALEETAPVWKNLLIMLRLIGLTCFIFSFLVFPDGRFIPSWTRWLGFIWAVYIVLAALFQPLRITASLLWVTETQALVFAWAILWLLIIAAVQVYRYRYRSSPTQRQQTKWVVYGLGVTIGLDLLVIAPVSLLPYLQQPLRTIMAARIVAFSVILFGQIALSLAIANAILRSRLWDIDIIIRRTLQYALLIGILALIYFGGVVLIQSIFSGLTGSADSPLITVLSTLAIAALFNPLRGRIQDFIDRRFYRHKYDAEQTLAQFAATARDEVDMDMLTSTLLSVVEDTMQPERVSLWLHSLPRSKPISDA
ncbi:MAG: hypothetical protein PVG14_01855 [Anaerolineales bacterium]